MNSTMTKKAQKFDVKRLVFTALMAALAVVLEQFLSFKVPVMPSFISFDFADVPAVLASLTMGPVSGVAVCLVKNLAGLFTSMTGGVGELSNFLLGCCYVIPAGLIYRRIKSRRGAALASLAGCAASAGLSLPINYFLIYPLYGKMLPMDTILGLYQALDPSCGSLFDALLRFNVPFTLGTNALVCALVFLIYKKLSPLLHGRR